MVASGGLEDDELSVRQLEDELLETGYIIGDSANVLVAMVSDMKGALTDIDADAPACWRWCAIHGVLLFGDGAPMRKRPSLRMRPAKPSNCTGWVHGNRGSATQAPSRSSSTKDLTVC